MNIRFHPLAVMICGVLISSPVFAAQETSQQDLGLSDYRYFKVYPHLERGYKAIKENNEARAISSFEHAHEMAPENPQLTLLLVEAYRHFGHNEKARKLLDEQLRKTPDNAEVLRARDVIPVPERKVESLADLTALQRECDAAPTIKCRSQVVSNAIKLGELNIAKTQFVDRTFRLSQEGHMLAGELSQRAIFLKQWQMADQSFALMDEQKTLNAAQYQQWFAILLQLHRDDRILDLQRQGVMNTPRMQLEYAQSLAQRNALSLLQRYLAGHHPAFETANDEHTWLRLLATYSQNPGQAVAQWEVKFPENRQYLLSTLVPIRIEKGDWQGASALLDEFPSSDVVNQRLMLSLAQRDKQQSTKLIRQISQQKKLSAAELDQFSYQMVKLGEGRFASELLLQYWPFSQAGAYQKTLNDRLYTQLAEHPEWISVRDKSRLSQPLPTVTQRMQQAQLFNGAQNCDVVIKLLGDFSPQYDARSWSRLAECYQHSAPGVAIYAAQQAAQRDPSAYYQRQVAYLAFATEQYSVAQSYWAKIPAKELTDDEVLIAARSAKYAGEDTAVAYWQNMAWQRGMPDINFESSPELDDAGKGFALLKKNDIAGARKAFEKALIISPDSPEILRQLVYVNQRLDDKVQTRRYSERVVDDIDNTVTPEQGLTDKQKNERFAFRRVNEDTSRRWTFSFDSSLGLTKDSMNSAGSGSGVPRDKSNRSYGQMEAEYRVGRNEIIEGDLLSVYSRVFAGSDGHSNIAPVYAPVLGLGVRWKPLREQTIFLAAEQQLPLDRHTSEADVMLRLSASFLNGGKFSDEWHPTGKGWLAQNLYLDAAHYVKQDYQIYTADYRMSWHHKISDHQTIEPYWHAQFNSSTNYPYYSDGEKYRIYRDNTLEGIGVRYNHWFGETHYDAFPHKASVGLEFQHNSGGHHRETDSKNGLFLTLGVRW